MCLWIMSSVSVDHAMCVCGSCRVCLWIMSSDYAMCVCGSCLVCLWIMSSVSVDHV